MATSGRARTWLIGIAVVGAAAAALAGGLLWLVFTRPVAFAQMLDGAL